MRKLAGEQGKGLSVEISSGQEGFSPVKYEGDGIAAKVLEPVLDHCESILPI
jgi:hypothetical protein